MILTRFQKLTTLVNSAGVRAEQHDHTPPPDEWARVVDANLTGTYLMSRAAMPALAATGTARSRTSGRSTGWWAARSRRPTPRRRAAW
jgi:NAD(P)-dependent dehydrogenase (short-subunit alcohol dehydrogenase family)